jgi:predicted DNA-binding antitoxin AbrB/MazE fold protein
MRTIPAVFENGVFKPEAPVSLVPGARVEIVLPDEGMATSEELRLRFPNACAALSAQDADEIMRIIDEEFGRIDPNDWA